MIKIIGLLLSFGLTVVRSIQLDPGDVVAQKEFHRIKELRPFAVEFLHHFENITQADLDLPSSRLPSQQDLQCLADIAQLTNGVSSGSFWALRMIDSWGTIPKGILYGNLIDMGNYDECIGINKAIVNSYQIKGKYCLAQFPILKSLPSTAKIAVCLPSSCSASNMDTFLGNLLQNLLGVNVTNPMVSEDTCRTSDRVPLDGLSIFTIVIISLLSVSMILATLWDYFLCDDEKQLPSLLKAFSARANSRSLFRLVEPNSNPNVIDCLHGMRCLSLIWVIFGHQYIFALMSPNMNYITLYRWIEQPFTSFVFHGVFSVDTFFFLSGMLLVLIALRSLEKTKGRLNVPMMYLHRYLRLTPIVALAILIYMKFLPLLADGPLYEDITFDDYNKCERTWFWTLLYLQNYATPDICISHTWYLAVDMQLYFLSPIFLIALYKWGKKAAAGIFVLMLLLSACLFSTMMTKKYSVHLAQGDISGEAQRKFYFATHTHAAPWLIGVLFGYFLHVKRNESFKLDRIFVWVNWIFSLALMFTSLFALYPGAQWSTPQLSMLDQASYYTFTRIAWPLSLCWVVFACKYGYGGLANSFLSSPLWQPLSKLSYSAYIFHVLIQSINGKRIRSNTYVSDYDVMLSFWGSFGFTVLMSYVIYIIIEAPFGALESLLLPIRRASPKPAVRDEPMDSTPLPEANQPLEAQNIETTTNPLPSSE